MKLFGLFTMLFVAHAGAALAQGVSPSGVIFGDGRDFNQDLTTPVPPPPRQGAADAERARRAERQRQANQNFPGTGRPVAAPTTQQPSAPRASAPAPATPPAATPPARPSAPSRPTVEPAAGPAEPRAATAAPPPSPRAAPVTIQPGQSTGAARGAASGTPASR